MACELLQMNINDWNLDNLYLINQSIISPRSLTPKVNQVITMNKMILHMLGTGLPKHLLKNTSAGGK